MGNISYVNIIILYKVVYQHILIKLNLLLKKIIKTIYVNTMKKTKKIINICNKSNICRNNLNIKRHKMPQFDDKTTHNFIKSLRKKNILVKKTTIDVRKLNPTQNQINYEAIKKLQRQYLKKKININKQTILVSKDLYILDGHHRWATLLLCIDNNDKCVKPNQKLNTSISVYYINLSIKKILKIANKFENVEFLKIGESK